jgi:predicted SprT family Zn-dependent metalloprotease
MSPADILELALQEQIRARAIVPDLGACPIVLSRARTELGSFLVDPHDGTMEIRISRHIDDVGQIRETARHELAHQAAWERYLHVGHGALWKTFATYLGCEPVVCSRFVLDPVGVAARQRYSVACKRCGWTTTRERRSKLVTKPWRFACSRCGGSLRVTILTADASD